MYIYVKCCFAYYCNVKCKGMKRKYLACRFAAYCAMYKCKKMNSTYINKKSLQYNLIKVHEGT